MEKLIYTIQDISEDLNIACTTVYQLIYSGKLIAHKRGKSWKITNDDYSNFLDKHKKYLDCHVSRAQANYEKACQFREMYNFEGYLDPTAYFALRRADSEERYHKMIKEMFEIINEHGFKVDGRITFIDKITGKVYR